MSFKKSWDEEFDVELYNSWLGINISIKVHWRKMHSGGNEVESRSRTSLNEKPCPIEDICAGDLKSC